MPSLCPPVLPLTQEWGWATAAGCCCVPLCWTWQVAVVLGSGTLLVLIQDSVVLLGSLNTPFQMPALSQSLKGQGSPASTQWALP